MRPVRGSGQRLGGLRPLVIAQSFDGDLAPRQLVAAKNQGKVGPTGIGFFKLRLHAAHALLGGGVHLHAHPASRSAVKVVSTWGMAAASGTMA